ncbi:MAG: hypothetical protein KKE76_15525 [Gammaproteobacteria bacterium]|nr:hypothetical protein [Gammaproteobacteria bacterium]
MSGFEFAFMGHTVAFDSVTAYGCLLAAVSFSAFCFALSREHKLKSAQNRPLNHPRTY